MVFADTSGFVAAFDARDASHAAVARVWQELVEQRQGLVTTQLVFAETVTHVRRRAGWEASRKVGAAIRESRSIRMVALDEEQLGAAWREFVRWPDPKLSLCDAASFIVMRDLNIRSALTLDRDFTEAGFELLP